MAKITMYAATGNMGYGYPEQSLKTALKEKPAFLGCDNGSCDPGPNYLGSGKAFVSRTAAKRDLRLLIKAGLQEHIPVIIGSGGGSGSDPGLAWLYDIAQEILREEKLSAKVALIHAEMDKGYLKEKLSQGKISPLDGSPDLSAETIDRSVHITAAMGPEPIQEALRNGAQIVLAGRATDASIYAAVPLMMGCAPGPVWHAAKVIECGAACSFPKTHDSMMAHIEGDSFVLDPPNPIKQVRCINAAAHTLYETVNPFRITEPDGIINTEHCHYEQIDERRVRVTGSRVDPKPYSVKLEGAESIGFRTVCIGGTQDPDLISILDEFLEKVRDTLRARVSNLYPDLPEDAYRLTYYRYGVDGVHRYPGIEKMPLPHEVGILMDVIAPTQEVSSTIMGVARSLLLHTDFPGRKCNAGNIGFPFSPSDIPVGEVYRFNMNHVLWLDDPLEPFPIEYIDIDNQ